MIGKNDEKGTSDPRSKKNPEERKTGSQWDSRPIWSFVIIFRKNLIQKVMKNSKMIPKLNFLKSNQEIKSPSNRSQSLQTS